MKFLSFTFLINPAALESSFVSWYENFSPGSPSSSALEGVLQDDRDGDRGWWDSQAWETTGPKIKENSLIIYFLPATIARHDRPLKTGGFDGNKNLIFWCLLSCVWPLRRVTSALSRDTRGWLRLLGYSPLSGRKRVMRTKWAIRERWLIDEWWGVCVFHSLKPGGDENLKSIGFISKGLVWLPVV